ncbi:putative nucleoprotein [Imjin River virus 1]|uniref:Putative nucleoprotein n=1 Tax=Imjin River virus 1 TaxID=1758883 RepID=A0A0S2RRJ4_9VIRU|nr:putative nucleoprotein [Imjin River virus 1]ALP32030.1 putative nucleoprotein [Imjin River virus 1]
MICREDFEHLRDCDNYSRDFKRRLEKEGYIFWTDKTVVIPELGLVLTKHDLDTEARRKYDQVFKGYKVRVFWYFDYSDLRREIQSAGTIGGKQKKKTGATKQKEKLEERRKSLSKVTLQPQDNEVAGPSGTQSTSKLIGEPEALSDSEYSDFGSEISRLFIDHDEEYGPDSEDSSSSSEEEEEVLEQEEDNHADMADGQNQGIPGGGAVDNARGAFGSLEANRANMLGEDYDRDVAIGGLRDASSIYWMEDLVNRHLVGASVYRELIFKNNPRVAEMSQDDKANYLPMLINVICQSRMQAINENGRIPLQVLMIAEMTGLYQSEKTANEETSILRMNAACLAILTTPEMITCCNLEGMRRLAPIPQAAGAAGAGQQGNNDQGNNNYIARDNYQGMFDEIMARIRADLEARPMVTPLAAYTCAITAIAKKGMVSQMCLEKILDGVRTDLGRQITLSTDLIRRYHDRFPITLTRENVASRMKAIEDIIPEDNLRLKIIIRQAALSGLTCITTIKKAMDTRPDFPWARVCALYPNEVQAATNAFTLIGDNPYYGFTSTMEGVASNRYKNLAYVAKEVLIRYLGDSDLRQYAGFPRTPLYPDRVAAIFDDYERREEPEINGNENQALLDAMRAAAVPYGY